MNNSSRSSEYQLRQVYKPRLKLEQETNTSCATVGDIITYTTLITNIGNLPVSDIVIMDMLVFPLQLIDGSVEINGLPQPELNLLSGIQLEDLDVNEYVKIKFKAKIQDYGKITNKMIATYEYQAPNCAHHHGKDVSNETSICIINTDLNIRISCDKCSASLNDIIDYTIILKNEGNVDLLNVVIKNPLPKYIILVNDSFTIDDNHVYCVDLNKGFTVPKICENETVVIKYSVRIAYTPCSAKYTTDLSVKIHYRLTNCCLNSKVVVPNNQCTINIGMSTFKQLTIEKYTKIPPGSPMIDCINSIKGTIKIKDYHMFKTPQGTSAEGQNLTGLKVSVKGVLLAQMDYSTCTPLQSVHCSLVEIPFSTFIVLPYGYNPGCGLDIGAIVEDIYFNKVDCKTSFISCTALINAKILSW